MESNCLSCFDGCQLPTWWRYLGENHTRDEDDEGNEIVTVYGMVYEDTQTGRKIRFCYLVASARYVIVEKCGDKYRTVCNFRDDMKDNLNEFIRENYKAASPLTPLQKRGG